MRAEWCQKIVKVEILEATPPHRIIIYNLGYGAIAKPLSRNHSYESSEPWKCWFAYCCHPRYLAPAGCIFQVLTWHLEGKRKGVQKILKEGHVSLWAESRNYHFRGGPFSGFWKQIYVKRKKKDFWVILYSLILLSKLF